MKTCLPFHLFGVALFPVLFLYANNQEYVEIASLVRAAAVSLALTLLLYALLRRITRRPSSAALLATTWWALFSIYGHVYQSAHGQPGLVGLLGRHSLLLPLFLAAGGGLAVWILRSRGSLENGKRTVSAVLAALVLIQLVTLGTGLARHARTERVVEPEQTTPSAVAQPGGAPDVYYIILDTYSRADVIQKEVNLDIGPFLEALRERGFYVADCAASNYDSTRVSLASSLNLDYIPNLDARFTPDNPNNALLDDYILHSAARRQFEALGYQTVAFATGFNFTELRDADLYLAPPAPTLLTPAVQPFEAAWLKTTGLRALFDTRPAAISGLLNDLSFPFSAHVARQRFILAELPKLAARPGPQFVFAHVILPHVPFVFRADGSITADDRYFREQFDQPVSQDYLVDGYRNQVEFLNTRLIEIIDQILIASEQPPVILLQGDHGLLYAEHHPILSAYYLPDGVDKLYPTISPVNSLRVVFNQVFGLDYDLLLDRSFASTYEYPYAFEAQTISCPVDR